jgi:hypothetical protein
LTLLFTVSVGLVAGAIQGPLRVDPVPFRLSFLGQADYSPVHSNVAMFNSPVTTHRGTPCELSRRAGATSRVFWFDPRKQPKRISEVSRAVPHILVEIPAHLESNRIFA